MTGGWIVEATRLPAFGYVPSKLLTLPFQYQQDHALFYARSPNAIDQVDKETNQTYRERSGALTLREKWHCPLTEGFLRWSSYAGQLRALS